MVKGDSMKIIFLDIDGVLNCSESIQYFYHKANTLNASKIFPDVFLSRLRKLIDLTDAKIVVSSTWRIDYPDGYNWVTLINNLKKYNLDKEITDITPDLTHPSIQRGDEIRKWLNDNKSLNIENFVIIDDDDDMREFTKTNLAQTSWITGFTEEVYHKALNILSK